MKIIITFLLTLLISLQSTQAFSQQLIPFQARLTDGVGAVVPDGVYAVNFNIYDAATAGTALWTETHSTVSVMSGVVNVILGSITPLNDPDNDGDLSDAVTFYTTDGNRFIGVTIGAGQEMVPRHQLVPSFHAATADNAGNASTADNAASLGGNLPSYYATNSDLQALSTSVANLTNLFYPVGSIYISTSATNPGAVLGGTWVAYGAGRTIVGEGGAFSGTGGSPDAVAVAHTHPFSGTSTSAGVHSHTIQGQDGDSDTNVNYYGVLNGGYGYDRDVTTSSDGTHTHNISGDTSSTGSSGTNANMPPYITTYIWQRTG